MLLAPTAESEIGFSQKTWAPDSRAIRLRAAWDAGGRADEDHVGPGGSGLLEVTPLAGAGNGESGFGQPFGPAVADLDRKILDLGQEPQMPQADGARTHHQNPSLHAVCCLRGS